jgi:hypothetical protein
MPQRLHKVSSVPLDLVGAVRRAYLRRGVFIAPISSNETDSSPQPKTAKAEGGEGPTPPDLTGSQEPQEVHEKLIDVTEKAQDVLFRAETVFPFTLFPDSIILDREKLTVVTRVFFRTAKITSVPISSISAAEADVGVLFGSAHISSKFFVQNKYSIQFLSRGNTLTLVHMLQGFIIAHEKSIDLTDIEREDLLMLLKDLGTGVTE